MLFHPFAIRATVLMAGLVAGVTLPSFISSAASAQSTSFPDTQSYWGQPFIQALAKRDIVTGYPDNTYRPEQPVSRDEFAAILQKAFSQPQERQIESGSVYQDVPQGYWAAPAIEEAYEMGFMRGYENGEFRPNQSITKAEVLTSLARNLDLPSNAATNDNELTAATATPVPETQQLKTQKRARTPLMPPMAMTMLMQPLVSAPAKAIAAVSPPVSPPTASSSPPAAEEGSAPLVVSDYYQDADQIPQYAVDAVAETTAAGIVVNYPELRMLNPTQPATRGEVAALIHQSLVQQGKISPLPDSAAAAGYIVGR